MGFKLCRRPCHRARRHRPTAARGGRPGSDHQRLSAEPATDRTRPAIRPGRLHRRSTAPVPRRVAPPLKLRSAPIPRRQPPTAPPTLSRSTHSLRQSRLAEPHDSAVVTRRPHVQAGNVDLVRLPHTAADDHRLQRHHHAHRPGIGQLRAGTGAEKACHHPRVATSTPYIDQFGQGTVTLVSVGDL
jgi:hypothetical protein